MGCGFCVVISAGRKLMLFYKFATADLLFLLLLQKKK